MQTRPVPRIRRQTSAPGSLPDRIVAILTEVGAPIRLAELIPLTKAPIWDVKKSLSALRAQKQVVIVGASRSARWATPSTAKGKANDD